MQDYKHWKLKTANFELKENIKKNLLVSDILATTIANRGIKSVEDAERFLNPSLSHLLSPFLFKDMEKACELIISTINNKGNILIYGDYDVDGVTSTVILLEGLNLLGANPEFYIPDRNNEGYGISDDGIKYILNSNFELVITVDCGISEIEKIKLLKDKGIKVVITDHHIADESLPNADAIINPCSEKDENLSSSFLSGAGVSYKLLSALYEKSDIKGVEKYLDLAALGTISDIVPLLNENRVIAKFGLNLINENPRLGIKAIIEAAGVKKDKITSEDISFIIAPRINSAGRMKHAEIAVELLRSCDPIHALSLAGKLNQFNIMRQDEEAKVLIDIEKMREENPQCFDENIFVAASKEWHLGVLGIVASKLVDKYEKPVFLAKEIDGYCKGSARCPDNFNIFHALENCKDLLESYGGHSGAGGFRVKVENLEAFKLRLISVSGAIFTEKPIIMLDEELKLSEISKEIVKELDLLEPYGHKNEKPLFYSSRVKINDIKCVGKTPGHLQINFADNSFNLSAIAFKMGGAISRIEPKKRLYDIIYKLFIDNWNNNERVKLEIKFLQLSDPLIGNILNFTEMPDDADKFKIIDARCMIDKSQYLDCVFLSPLKVFVYLRNMKEFSEYEKKYSEIACFIDSKFEGDIALKRLEGFENGEKKVLFSTSGFIPENNANIRDVIFLHPPSSVDVFYNAINSKNGPLRFHMVFNDDELKLEVTRQKIIFPDRERMIKIFKTIKDLTTLNYNYDRVINTLPERVGDNFVRKITGEIAVKTFEELGILSFVEKKSQKFIVINKIVNTNLEDSAFYRKLKENYNSFMLIKKHLTSSRLDGLKTELLKKKKKDID